MNQSVSFVSHPEKAIEKYFELGFHIEPNVFNDEECTSIVARSATLQSAKNGIYTPVMMPHRQDPHFLLYMNKPLIVNFMKRVLGGDVSGIQSQFFYMPPGTQGFTAHQDNYFVQAANDAFVSAWLALEDATPDNGGLIVYPRSHKEGILPVQETQIKSDSAQDPNAYRTQCLIPDRYQSLSVTVPKGAVLFIHSCIVHASNNNQSKDLWRHVLLNTYIRKGAAFRPGRDAKRVEIDLDSIDYKES